MRELKGESECECECVWRYVRERGKVCMYGSVTEGVCGCKSMTEKLCEEV